MQSTENNAVKRSDLDALIADLEYARDGAAQVRRHGTAALLSRAVKSLATERGRADQAQSRLAEAWDDGVRVAGGYGHEDNWSQEMTPYSQNPYRSEATA